MTRTRRPHSIRSLLIYFALAIVLPGALAATGLIAWNLAEARKAREEQLLTSARIVSAAVDRRVSQLTTIADALASSEALAQEDWSRLSERFARFDLGPQAWLSVTDAEGARLLNTFPGRLAAAQGLPRPPDVVQAVASAKPTVSDVFKGPSSGRTVIAVNAPLDGDPRQRVVTLVMEAASLAKLIQSFPIEQGGFITVVDRRSHVIARTRDQAKFEGVPATGSMQAAIRASATGVVPSVSLDGQATIVAFTRSELTGWTTMVVIPRARLSDPILANALGLAGVTALLMLIGLLIANLLGRMLARELVTLEQDAIHLGQGQPVSMRNGPVTQVNTVHGAMSVASVELARRDERQRLMIHELNHRVKNTLATVQALAAQTFRGDPAEAPARFDKRLQALAGAHDLLTQAEWKAVDMREVATRCLDQVEGERIRLSGPSFPLQPHEALALCMCLHELTTNSLKYGALSVAAGNVALSWSSPEPGRLELEWREIGGPAVKKPSREGFGTRLMDRLAKGELAGEMSRDYAESGLIVTGRFDLTGGQRWRSDFDE